MIERILGARVYDVARETPLERAPRLSNRLGVPVWLKREDLQPVFSFKLRGAYNRMTRLDPGEAERGVIAASAGNHSQGVALAASRLGLRARIVMPTTTPRIKVDAVSDLGAEVVLHGDTYDDADALVAEEAARLGLTRIHPYDDLDVIAGQGTIAVEILRQHPDPIDTLYVPVGGGGLAAGITVYTKFLRPETRVIGVEPEDAACLHAALEAGRRVRLDSVGIFADGVAVAQVGEQPFGLLRDRIDGVVRVDTDAICAAILDIFEDTRTMAEPAGALAVAGLKQHLETKGAAEAGARVAVVSGANINFHRLRHISERAELGQHREAILGVTIPERPGSFREFCASIGDASITEFNYRYADPGAAHVFLGIELAQPGDKLDAIERLQAAGYSVVDMTANETAKLHARHLVGGRAAGVLHERVFRFEFPERPGALRRFLDEMGRGWNITLFHYRNHGAERARVLVGLQIPPGESGAFEKFRSSLAFPCAEETDNPAYRLFLASE